MYKLAILMACYNRVSTTLDCLKSVFAQELPDGVSVETWLVDDGSPDGTGEKVKCAFPMVQVVYGNGSLFWCRGMRLAWESAFAHDTYDAYLWLNDDVVLNRGAIASLLADSQALGEKSIVVGTTTQDGSVNSRITYGLRNNGESHLVPCGKPLPGNGRMSGNVVFVPVFVFKKLGYISNSYHHAYGDHDYGFLAARKGIGVYAGSNIAGACKCVQKEHFSLAGLLFHQRIAALWDAKGLNLHDALIYKYRRTNLIGAVMSFFHIVWLAIRGGGGAR